MIYWPRFKPEMPIVDVLKLRDKIKKKITLSEAMGTFANSPLINHHAQTKAWIKRILTVLDGKKSITEILVKDANTVFEKIRKEFTEIEGYRCRAVVGNSIRFVLSGGLPDKRSPSLSRGVVDNSQTGDVAKFSTEIAETNDIIHLIPLVYSGGRFGHLKSEVRKVIYTLKPTQTGIIRLQKKNMTEKEGFVMAAAVTKTLVKANLPWVVAYNPTDNILLVIRKDTYDKVVNPNKTMKEKD